MLASYPNEALSLTCFVPTSARIPGCEATPSAGHVDTRRYEWQTHWILIDAPAYKKPGRSCFWARFARISGAAYNPVLLFWRIE